MKKWLPWIIAGACALWIVSTLRLPREKEGAWAAQEFGRLPIFCNGRLQPIDSLARNSLLQLREKQSIYLKEEKRYLTATEWVMEVMMKPDRADTRRAFRVDHPELKSLLSLPEANESKGEDGKHYTWNQIKPALPQMEKEGARIAKIEAPNRTPFDRAVVQLQNALGIYMRLRNSMHPETTTNFLAELAQYEKVARPGFAAAVAKEQGKEHDQAALDAAMEWWGKFQFMAMRETPLLVPPHEDGHGHEEWASMGEALMDYARGEPMPPAVEAYAAIAVAYHDGKVADFNKAVADYRQMLAPQFNKELTKAGRETFFNHIEPFYKAMILYVGALLLALAAFLTLALSPGTSETFRRSAFWLIVLAWLVHTTGLLFRMLLEGRPPVTNLYSSAIFIGWGAVVLCMILEMIFRIGIGAIVSAVAGFATLIIAHNLALNGDTMEMLRAVLDTNFWLATHVVAVTIGYASTFVAGLLAITYVVLGLFTPNLGATLGKRGVAAMGGAGGAAGFVAAGPVGAAAAGVAVTKGLSRSIGQINLGQALTKMIYGIVCFATLFSFVGTVLGGIWADQSWGRFWGWDPKENGALIIVLWNALILHARWGGMVRERGLANMAIFGNIVTSWSWFGVNMLGIGLHSYGFMDSAFKWLMAFVGSQVLLIALGLIPQKYWMSFRNRTAPAPSAIEVEPAPSAKPKPSPAGA